MQNLVSFTLSDAQISVIDQALAQLEQQLADLIILKPDSKLRMAKLGDKSESFCRQSLQALADNPHILPPTLDVIAAQKDLDTRDLLRPRLMRLECLLQRGNDTATALGSDALSTATQGYSLLKVVGRSAGLEPLRRELSNRFAKAKRAGPSEKKAA